MAVVVVNYNTRKHLRHCLISVLPEQPAEVVVVDNASTDGSPELVKEDFPAVHLIARKDNPGYGAGANQGIRATSARYVLLLNSDTLLPAGGMQALADYLDGCPEVAMLGPALTNLDGSFQPSAFPEPTPLNTLVLNTYLLDVVKLVPWIRRRFRSVWQYPDGGSVAWVKGAALALRRSAFEDVRGFDESYYMYSEEVDFAYRLRKAGWEIHFTPTPKIVHDEGASTQLRRSEMNVQLFHSISHFYRRHFSDRRLRRLRWVIRLIMVQRIVRDSISRLRTRNPEHRRRMADEIRLWRRLFIRPVPPTDS